MTEAKQRIVTTLRKRFTSNHYEELLVEYFDSGLSPPHIVTDLETGDEKKLWPYIWEAMLFRHLCSLGLTPRNLVTKAGQKGPDFFIQSQGRKIWIEAIAPSPEGIPEEWLAPPKRGQIKSATRPDEERVLRCTSAICDKQKKFDKYRAKGIVGTNDCTVIAVSILRLSDFDLDGVGYSQLPLAMEALFPIGKLAVPIAPDGGVLGPSQNLPRWEIRKPSGSVVPTGNFLDPAFANVSAVVQSHQKDMCEKPLVISVMHNRLATNPLPRHILGASREFVATDLGDRYQITDIA